MAAWLANNEEARMSMNYSPWQPEPAVTEIFERHWPLSAHGPSLKQIVHRPTVLRPFAASMRAMQIELIEHHLPRMAPEDAARARKTLDWLREQAAAAEPEPTPDLAAA
jgi:hypothetical protein